MNMMIKKRETILLCTSDLTKMAMWLKVECYVGPMRLDIYILRIIKNDCSSEMRKGVLIELASIPTLLPPIDPSKYVISVVSSEGIAAFNVFD